MGVDEAAGAETADADLIERYVAALAYFGQRVADVADHEWDLPTPCDEWDVRQIVAHVVLGEAQFTDVLAGRSGATNGSDPMEVDASIVGVHPMSVWRGTALAAIEQVRQPGVLERTYDHPSGTLTGRQLVGWRISENLLHGWDLAQAVGRPAPIDDDMAEGVLDFWLPVALEMAPSGDYGEPREPPADVSAGERLLALVGRR